MIKKKNMVAIGVGFMIGLLPMSVHAGEADIAQVQNAEEVIVEEINEDKVDVEINEENFPDPVFRQFVLDNYGDGGQVLTAERIGEITSIWCCDLGIKSLEGIEFFPELDFLQCSDNELSSLDVSHNPKLRYLSCGSNKLSSLDVSQNPELSELDCSTNELSSLDVSHNLKLSYLFCPSNKLSNLDVSQNSELNYLECSGNELSSLDMSNNPKLSYLGCGDMEISSLDISQNSELSELQCCYTSLSSLDVSHNSKLGCLNCENIEMNNLDVSQNPELNELNCSYNVLSDLDVSHNPKLSKLDCSDNNLSSLDVSQNSELSSLDCDSNNLSSLDVSQNPELSNLSCFNNELSNLDVSNNPKLSKLNCSDNKLSSLDVSQNSELSSLYCGSNKLSSLDVSQNSELSSLYCGSNNLSSLDISQNPELNELDCRFSELSSLDVSHNPKLSELCCFDNELSSLDVSQNPELSSLYCGSNNLSSLDASHNPKLSYLDCSYNNLSSLDVSQNLELNKLDCSYNNLSNLDVSHNPKLSDLSCTNNQLACLDLSKNLDVVSEDICSQVIFDNTQIDMHYYDEKFDSSKVSELQNLELNGNVITVIDGNRGSYNYDCGNGITMEVIVTNLQEVKIDEENFPDPIFRQFVLDNYGDERQVLTAERIKETYYINCAGLGIKSLEGIEFFAELLDLCCTNNELSRLDVSKNLELNTLSCTNNQLACLDLSNSLDVSVTEDICSQIIFDNAQIDMLQYDDKFDPSKVSGLQNLELNGNVITVTDGKKGTYKYDCGNGVTMTVTIVIGVEVNEENFPDPNFRQFVLGYCGYGNQALTAEKIEEITDIDVSHWGKKIKSLEGIEFFKNLKYLDCSYQGLNNLDVSKNPELYWLRCFNNELSSLDVSNNPKLTLLECHYNKLSSLDVNQNPELSGLVCAYNELNVLDVSDNPKLKILRCESNKLRSLDVSNNLNLSILSCTNNQFGCLDLSNNIDVDIQEEFANGDIICSQIMIDNEQIDMYQYDEKFDASKVSGLQNLELNGNLFTLIGGKKGTYNYDCGNNITMQVTIVAGFDDVPKQPGNWKYESIKYVNEQGIMGGVGGSNQFQPDNTLTRAMFATVLYRMAGEETVTFEDKFTDVDNGIWYSSAIIWANKNGIVNGYSDGTYGINDNITREQIAKMLYEYAKTRGYDISQMKELEEFTDKDSVSGWATNYMKWATAVGMISGKPNGDGSYRLDPKGDATRAECAAMIMRFEKKYK